MAGPGQHAPGEAVSHVSPKPSAEVPVPREDDAAVAGRDVEFARSVFDDEIAGLQSIRARLGDSFDRAVDLIHDRTGRLIVSGVGKSGLIAKSLAGTLTSTGTPSFYLHPVEAAHGDLGLVNPGDVVMIISKSGMSDELRPFIPPLRKLGAKIIAMTGEENSFLAKNADVVLNVHVDKEAGTLGLPPTTSTTVALVMGHAIATALVERNGFTAEDFARVHPSGILGKRLTLTVREIMRKGNDIPLVHQDTPLRGSLIEIMEKSIGCTGVTDDDGVLVGIITDGDLKRIMAKHSNALDVPVRELMTRDPKTCSGDMLAADALAMMELNRPGPLLMYFVVDDDGRPSGLLHLHDILKAGLTAE
jgi:arabinose-5-phosphate isomerase